MIVQAISQTLSCSQANSVIAWKLYILITKRTKRKSDGLNFSFFGKSELMLCEVMWRQPPPLWAPHHPIIPDNRHLIRHYPLYIYFFFVKFFKEMELVHELRYIDIFFQYLWWLLWRNKLIQQMLNVTSLTCFVFCLTLSNEKHCETRKLEKESV